MDCKLFNYSPNHCKLAIGGKLMASVNQPLKLFRVERKLVVRQVDSVMGWLAEDMNDCHSSVGGTLWYLLDPATPHPHKV